MGDDADKAFYGWKKCVQCASEDNSLADYDYDKDLDSCANSSAESRSFCECDRLLINSLKAIVPANSNYNADDCVPSYMVFETSCCNWNSFHYSVYLPRQQCCGQDGVKEIGTC